jgi:ADP-glucose pyrophosphorylase
MNLRLAVLAVILSAPARAASPPAASDTSTTEMHVFDEFAGPVPAHHHANGGGWVAESARVSPDSFVGQDAEVYEGATVEQSKVQDLARVHGGAKVSGSTVRGRGEVSDRARVADLSVVDQEAKVYDDAEVRQTYVGGEAQVYGAAFVGKARDEKNEMPKSDKLVAPHGSVLMDGVEVHGKAKVFGSQLSGRSKVDEDAQLESVLMAGAARAEGAANVTASKLLEKALVLQNANVERSTVKGTAIVQGEAELKCVTIVEGTVDDSKNGCKHDSSEGVYVNQFGLGTDGKLYRQSGSNYIRSEDGKLCLASGNFIMNCP